MLDFIVRILAAAQDEYGLLTLVAVATPFVLAEIVLPHHRVDKRVHLHVDLLAVSVGIVWVGLAYSILRRIAERLTLERLTEPLAVFGDLPILLRLLLVLICIDFILYWLHRAMHRYTALWRTHAWHHSVEHLYWFSGFRASFFHILMYAVPQMIFSHFLFRLTPAEVLVASAMGHFFQLLQHSSLKGSVPVLSWLFVNPDYHRVHHSARLYPARNLGHFLTVWDRLFGTYYDPATLPEDEPLGLGNGEARYARMIVGV